MRKISKIASALALSCALALGASAPALADVTYKDRSLAVTGSGSYTATDLFGGFKDVMPGDELDQPVTVANESGKTVRVYLRAEAHGDSNPLTYSEAFEEADGKDQATDPEAGIGGPGQRDETAASMADFLRQLHLTVTAGGAVVFDATPDLEAQLAESVLLGELAPGEALRVDAHLSVPIEMGDAYANRVGEVDWVFTAEELDEPAAPEAPADKPADPLSQTGDSSPVLLLATLAGAAVVVAAAALLLSRRSRR